MRTVLAVILLISVVACTQPVSQATASDAAVTDYASCVAAGNAVLKSYPPQCVTADGRRFVRTPLLPRNTPAPGSGLCEDKCGDGVCQEIVCLGSGCPCAESKTSCSADCS